MLVFGAGTDYALLLVARYREELRRHDSEHEAMQLALRTAGPAIFFSGLTVMAALLVLTLAEVNSTAGLGPIGAMGIAMAMTVHAHDAARALVVVCGRRAFWPFVPDGPGGPLVPHTHVWRRIFSLLVGGIGAAIGSTAGGAGSGDRVSRRRAAELLRARAGLPPVRPQGVLSGDRAQARRAPPGERRDARRSGGGSASVSPPAGGASPW